MRLRDAAGRAAPILAGQRELARAEERAVSDELTGLPNRRAADETIRRMVAHAGRALSPLGVVLLDLDRFRVLNELHGHSHGDKALAAVGRLLAATARASDFVARYGGEEFLLVLPDTDRLGCLEVAEKIRRAIERAELVQTGPITASLGVACLPDDAVDPEHLIRQADRALYVAKAQGRNRVQAADPSAPAGLEPGGELRTRAGSDRPRAAARGAPPRARSRRGGAGARVPGGPAPVHGRPPTYTRTRPRKGPIRPRERG